MHHGYAGGASTTDKVAALLSNPPPSTSGAPTRLPSRQSSAGSMLSTVRKTSSAGPGVRSASVVTGIVSPTGIERTISAGRKAGAGNKGAPVDTSQLTPQQQLRVAMRGCSGAAVARETLLFLMEQPETVTCPLSFLQHQHSLLLEESLTAVSSSGELKARVSAVAESQVDAVDLHLKYVQLFEDSLAKDEKILQLQKRTLALEKNASAVQHTLVEGEGIFGSSSSGSSSKGRRGGGGGTSVAQAERERTALEELQSLNTQMSEYIDTLEHNLAMGFHYSDLAVQKTLTELQLEKEELLKRNIELAECFVRANAKKEGLEEAAVRHQELSKECAHKIELLEKELSAVRGELARVKRVYQDRAMAAA